MSAARLWLVGFLVLLLGQEALGSEAHRPDSHAPIGVLGDHMHRTGEWMLAYRAFVSPSPMGVDLAQLAGVMFAPRDDLTLMGMVLLPLVSDLQRSSFRVMALYALHRAERDRWHLNLGLQLPRSFRVGLTYFGQGDQGSWGLQGIGRLGPPSPSLALTAWRAKVISKDLSGSLRVLAQGTPRRFEVRWGFGLNLYRSQAPLSGHRLAVEVLFLLSGSPGSSDRWRIILGWQYAGP